MAIVVATAAARAVHPSPPPPPAAPRTVAWLACTHLALAAVDAVFFLFLASMWLLFWGLATMDIGRLACGEGCAVVTAAYKVVSVAAWVFVVLVIPLMFILLALTIAHTKVKAAATDIEATEVQESVPKRYDAAVRDALRNPVIWFLGLVMVFALLMLIGVLVKGDSPVMGSRREKIGSLIYGVGAMGMNVADCFFLCPAMTFWIWGARKMARHAP